MTMTDLLPAVERLHIQNGDVVILRMDVGPEEIDRLRQALTEAGKSGLLFIHLRDDETIEALPADEMKQHGWVRS